MWSREGVALTVLALIILTLPINLSLNHCQVQNPIEITSVMTGRLLGTTWVKSDEFLHDETMSVNVTAQNSAQDEEATTIYASAYDEINVPFGSAKVDITLSGGEAQSILVFIYVPTWAYSGDSCQIIVSTLSSNETTHVFSLLPQTAGHLTVNCLVRMTSSARTDIGVTIDNRLYWPSLTIALPPGIHTIQVPRSQQTVDEESTQLYVFLSWNGSSFLTSLTVNITGGTNQTLNAYYTYVTINFRRLVPTPLYIDGCTL